MKKRVQDTVPKTRVLSPKARLWLILVLSVVLPDPFKSPFSLRAYLVNVVLYFSFTILGWSIVGFFVKRLRLRYSAPQEQLKRSVLQFMFIVLFTAFFSILVAIVVKMIFNNTTHFSWTDYVAHFKSMFILVVCTSVIFEVLYSFKRWDHAHREAELLRGENAIAQLETLKTQVNPHFLFNSLNTLSASISENPALAETFVEKLSDFYRYVLDTQHKNMVSLATELQFVKAYVFLQNIRFGQALEVVMEERSSTEEVFIPPLVLQMLLENAIKHNSLSQTRPLIVKLTIKEDEVVVQNKIYKKITPEPSTGLGLQNIRKRVEFLSGKTVKVQHTEEEFIVIIPLVTPEKI
ncbi:MAG TPA: histidine kinase [Cytophagaceae bacterium]|jgi:sensor histidine kinase YesM|nr:histidine kinase [Cytophagaceae bacterium]